MALLRKTIKEEKDTGFGNNSEWVGGRLVNKDGSANVRKVGLPFLESISWYHTLLKLNRWHFLGVMFVAFLTINIVFTIFYYLFGVQHLNGIAPSTGITEFSKVYFFSIQTFTTVGYGHISPNGFGASAIAAVEAFCGLLFFALATGLLYGRFAKPNAYIKFSANAIIAPYQQRKGLMFRLVPYKDNQLTEAEVKLSLALEQIVDGKKKIVFFQLPTELDKVNSLSLSWTIVHPINEESPLYGFTENDFITSNVELLVFIKAFDESFSNMVVARTSYTYNEMIYGAKFTPMYHRDASSNTTIIEIDKLNNMEKVAFA